MYYILYIIYYILYILYIDTHKGCVALVRFEILSFYLSVERRTSNGSRKMKPIIWIIYHILDIGYPSIHMRISNDVMCCVVLSSRLLRLPIMS